MFFLTARISKKKVLLTVLALATAVAIIVFLPKHSTDKNPKAESVDEIVCLLEDFGWQVDSPPLEAQEIVIPEEFSAVYEQYNLLQKQAGFDLSRYCGCRATRYSFLVNNCTENGEAVYADVLICNGRLIGGDVHSLSIDGMMKPLI